MLAHRGGSGEAVVIAYWFLRTFQPFNIAAAGAVVFAGLYIVSTSLSGSFEASTVILVVVFLALILLCARGLMFALSRDKLRITEDTIEFPVRVSAATFQWWRGRLKSAGLRFFGAHGFGGELSRQGFSGAVQVGHLKTVIVNYPMEQIVALSVRRRGLTELEVDLILEQEAHPFVFRIQTLGWPFTIRKRIEDRILGLIPKQVP